jgi:flavodoxin
MKRIMIWVDSPEKDAREVAKQLKECVAKAGVRITVFEAIEIMDSENE